MRQTSEDFANAMIEDMERPNTSPSFAEQIANMEKRINERIQETEKSIFSKIDALGTSETTPVEVTEIEPSTENETEIETVTEEEKGE